VQIHIRHRLSQQCFAILAARAAAGRFDRPLFGGLKFVEPAIIGRSNQTLNTV
jgi:hypothetical protein